MEDLSQKHEAVGIRSGNELLLRFPEAEQFISDCRSARLVIVRMDFYRQKEGSIVPSLLYADLFEYVGVSNGVELAAEAAQAILKKEMPERETLVSFVTCPHEGAGEC